MQQSGDRRRLAPREEQGVQVAELLGSTEGDHGAGREKSPDGPKVFGDVPLERQDADLHRPARSSSRIALARSNRMACSATSRATTRSTSSGRAPALVARFRACSSI